MYSCWTSGTTVYGFMIVIVHDQVSSLLPLYDTVLHCTPYSYCTVIVVHRAGLPSGNMSFARTVTNYHPQQNWIKATLARLETRLKREWD